MAASRGTSAEGGHRSRARHGTGGRAPAKAPPAAGGSPAARKAGSRPSAEQRQASEMLERIRVRGDALDVRVDSLLGRLGLSG